VSRFTAEIQAYLERAEQSLAAAQVLAREAFYDFAASRAYYAAFYAAEALLIREGLEFTKHSAVIAAIHQHFVKPGRLSPEMGKALSWLFELRNLGDYNLGTHLDASQAGQALTAAAAFIETVKTYLQRAPD